jgi:hypothetical protein
VAAEGAFRALLIGNSSFPNDPENLPALLGPQHDVDALEAGLTDSDCGLFSSGNVKRLVDENAMNIKLSMEDFYQKSAQRDDCLLLYYSGHGVLDIGNRFYICARDTSMERLNSSGIQSTDVSQIMEGSPARRFIVILDCCHSGRWKAAARLPERLMGTGRFIIASSKPGQLSADAKMADSPSPFTRHLVEALTTSELEPDEGSYVTLDAIYGYVFNRLESEGPQRPVRNFDGVSGTVPLARRQGPAHRGTRAASRSTGASARLYVSETEILLPDVSPNDVLTDQVIDVFNAAGGPIDWEVESDAEWIAVARRSETAFAVTLRPRPGVNRGKVRVSSPSARQSQDVHVEVRVLDREPAPRLAVDPNEIDFGVLSIGEQSPIRTVRLTNLGGGELRSVATVAGSGVHVDRRGDLLELRVDTSSARAVTANVAVESAGGSVDVPVRARVLQGPVLMVKPAEIRLGSGWIGEGARRRRITVRNAGSGTLEWDYGATGTFLAVERDDRGLLVGARIPSLLPREGSIWLGSNGGEATIKVRAGPTDLAYMERAEGPFPAPSRSLGPTSREMARWRERLLADEAQRAAARAANPTFFADARWWIGSVVLLLLTAGAAVAVGLWPGLGGTARPSGRSLWPGGEFGLLAAAGSLVGLRLAWAAASQWRFDPGIGWRAIFLRRIRPVMWLAITVGWAAALTIAASIPSHDLARPAVPVFILGVLVITSRAVRNIGSSGFASAGSSWGHLGAVIVVAGSTLLVMVVAAALSEAALAWVVEPYHFDLPAPPATWLLYVAACAWTAVFIGIGAWSDEPGPRWWRLVRNGLLGGWCLPTVAGMIPLNLWAPWAVARLLGLVAVPVFGMGPYGILVACLFILLTALVLLLHLLISFFVLF